MSWSLDRLHIKEPVLIDAVMLAVGKALYISNNFEQKCRFLLRVSNLGSFLEKNPQASLADAIASLAKDKMLGGTISDLKLFPYVKKEQVEALEGARDARNFIAHEGALLGPLSCMRSEQIEAHLSKLRAAVDALVLGDNIVSKWVFEVEEKEGPPVAFAAQYPLMVRRWVFGHIDAIYSIDECTVG